MHQLANRTDITFTRPPATAAAWTRNDFADFEPGGSDTSVHPRHTSLEDVDNECTHPQRGLPNRTQRPEITEKRRILKTLVIRVM
jgi:hypothetical protein